MESTEHILNYIRLKQRAVACDYLGHLGDFYAALRTVAAVAEVDRRTLTVRRSLQRDQELLRQDVTNVRQR